MKNFQEFVKQIESSNAAFKKMNKSRRRVQIAKDVIERIKLANLVASTGKIVDLVEHKLEGSYSLKDFINSPVSCSVCAKGGLFMSYVGRVNKFSEKDFSYDLNTHHCNEMTKLLELFTEEQLVKIEYAFEGGQYVWKDKQGNDIDLTEEETDKLDEFYDENKKDDNARLIKICENIIKNKGEFVP